MKTLKINPLQARVAIGNRQPSQSDVKVLAASIAALGLLQKPMVRGPDPADGFYEIVYGARRVKACIVANLQEVQVDCLPWKTDEVKVQAMRFTENTQRRDLSPMELAKTIRYYREHGHSTIDLVNLLNMSKGQIARAEALCDLIPEWMKILDDGATQERPELTLSGALVIARQSREIQEQLFRDKSRILDSIDPDSIRQFITSSYHTDLTLAPFSIDDAMLLPAAGSCTACPKRSTCNPDLWDDFEPATKGKLGLCLDKDCWVQKDQASHLQAVEKAKVKPVLQISRWRTETPFDDLPRVGEYAFTKVPAKTPGAVAAYDPAKRTVIYMDPKSLGQASKEVKAAIKASKPEATPEKKNEPVNKTAAGEKVQQLLNRRMALVHNDLKQVLAVAAYSHTTKILRDNLFIYWAFFGQTSAQEYGQDTWQRTLTYMAEASRLPKVPPDVSNPSLMMTYMPPVLTCNEGGHNPTHLAEEVWNRLVEVFMKRLGMLYQVSAVTGKLMDMVLIADCIDSDEFSVLGAYLKACKEVPIPKAWATRIPDAEAMLDEMYLNQVASLPVQQAGAL